MLYTFEGKTPDVHPSVFIAPSAILIGAVSIGKESSIWFQTVARADINSIEIGSRTNIQDGCMLHVTNRHPLKVGNNVTAGHGAILHGCTVEDDCLIAMGAVILDGAVIGKGSLIAAGSVVAPGTQVPPQSLVMGVPGKVVRQVTEVDSERVAKGWRNYIGYAERYKQGLQQVPD